MDVKQGSLNSLEGDQFDIERKPLLRLPFVKRAKLVGTCDFAGDADLQAPVRNDDTVDLKNIIMKAGTYICNRSNTWGLFLESPDNFLVPKDRYEN